MTWETSSEVNNKGFQIEHSTDGKEFIPIGWVEGEGTTTESQSYRYIHNNPTTGLNYYRLAQKDNDNSINYSDIRAVRFVEQLNEVSLYPNPIKNGESPTLQVYMDKEQLADIRVFDTAGKLLYQQQQELSIGFNQIILDTKNLSQGLYLVNLSYEGNMESLKLNVLD